MKDYQEKFIRLALNAEALIFGDFTLKSGRNSPYFFNAAKMLNTKFLADLSECYTKTLQDLDVSFDSIYGPAYKGIFLGSIVAALFSEQGKNYPLSFNRKEEKNHGEGGNIIGANPKGKVLIIDDVLSAGTAGRESIESILSMDAIPSCFIVGLNRQEKGQSEISSSEELKNEFNLRVESIINLDTLIIFVEQESQYSSYLSLLNKYRETWSA